jgi:hypothetical protein
MAGAFLLPEEFDRDLVELRQYFRSSMAALGKWADGIMLRSWFVQDQRSIRMILLVCFAMNVAFSRRVSI